MPVRRRNKYFDGIPRRLVLGSLILIGTLVAAGCGTTSSSPRSGASDPPKGTITIADWEFTETGVGPAMEHVLTAYTKTHPGVTVKFAKVSYDSYAPTIKTEIGGQGGPDVMVLVDSDFASLQQAGDLSPITSLTASEQSALLAANAQAKVNGKRYGVIWETVIYDFLYNKNLLHEAGIASPPGNFATFLSDCKTVKAKTGQWGYAARNMLNETVSWYQDFTGTWIDGYGGGWTNAAGKFTIDSPANVAAVTAFNTVYHSGCMDTGVLASVFRASYVAGNVGMLMDNSDAGYTYTFGNPILTNAIQGAGPLPFPTKTSGDQQLFLAINKYSKNKALDANFMTWLLQPAQQRALIGATAPQTTATKVLPSRTFTAAHTWAKPYYSQVANGVSELVAKRPALTNQLAELVMPYIAQVLSGQLTPKAALTEAQHAAVAAMGN